MSTLKIIFSTVFSHTLRLPMTNYFTSDDLIQLLYNEVCDSEALAMKKAMVTNTTLRKEFNGLKKAKESLPRFLMEPSGFIIDRILTHSLSMAV